MIPSKIYEALRKKNLDDEQAKGMVGAIEQSFQECQGNQKEFLKEIFVTKEKFHRKINEMRSELIKWMSIFWVGQIGVLTAILFAFFGAK